MHIVCATRGTPPAYSCVVVLVSEGFFLKNDPQCRHPDQREPKQSRVTTLFRFYLRFCTVLPILVTVFVTFGSIFTIYRLPPLPPTSLTFDVWMFGGFERPNSSENRAKIEFGGQMEDPVGPKMDTRTENAGQYDPKLAPTRPNGVPSGLKNGTGDIGPASS